MPDVELNGIIVTFPFEPYDVQIRYMEKVIECLQDSKHGVLESPTGTGKTLSLLCSSLSWLLVKKAQLQSQALKGALENPRLETDFFTGLTKDLNNAVGQQDQPTTSFNWGMPKIIYASRTHSQLSQAMQELKRTSYKHVKVAVLGSRDQLCIHPEVSKENNNANKIHMCQAKVKARTCFYYNNVDVRKTEPIFREEILDIEDLVKNGQKLRCCPYFLSKELKQTADIVFMPYNYVLDPRTRKAQGLELQNNILLLDEAHNVEKTCEDSASLQISSTDIAICIDEITAVMKDVADEVASGEVSFESGSQKDFTPEDLCILKTMFLEFEKAIDGIEIKNRDEGETFPGGYIFELLEKAEVTQGRDTLVIDKLDKIVLYLTTTSSSPFTRKGNALQKFNDLLRIVFSGGQASVQHKDRVKRCYKVHVMPEEIKKGKKNDGWEPVKIVNKKSEGKVISYWCFSPGFGMQQIVDQGIRSIVLTSGTLSPLKPLISELAIPIHVQLENPHIVTSRQVCIGVLSNGPDGHPLNSSYNTRNDPKYVASLGRTIYNFSCLIPYGMLVFFPSYPILKKCQEDWQNSGLWMKICERKPIYVEGQLKHAFINTMKEFYEKIQDPSCKGAIFMAVCRGKVSEGLDFADMNGRAVLVTGLPFPPLKDPRIILKQRYLEENRGKDREALTGQQWYQLEASRAVNQAIGRIIRHKNDYGAIILCDCRFENPGFRKQLSAWLQPHVKKFTNFGMITKELREFFRSAERDLPQPKMKSGGSSISEQFSLPAMTASFDETPSRILKSSKIARMYTPSVPLDDFDLKKYTGAKPTEEPTTEIDKTNIFQSINLKSKPVINFSDCKLKADWDRCALTREVDKPIVKKRKIRIVGTKTDISEASTSAESCSMYTETQADTKYDTRKHREVSDEKKEIGKIYLKDVKRSLTEENYKKFTLMVQNYTKNADYNELLRTLESLFPKSGSLWHLCKGFKRFLKKQHIDTFNTYVSLADNRDL